MPRYDPDCTSVRTVVADLSFDPIFESLCRMRPCETQLVGALQPSVVSASTTTVLALAANSLLESPITDLCFQE